MPLNPRIARLSQDDWSCAALQGVFEPEFYQELVLGLHTLEWAESCQRFYRQREVNLKGVAHYERLFDHDRRSKIASGIGTFFGVDFGRDFDIAAHKMIKGDYIGIHTDANEHGETHRLTVTLNEDWDVRDGGVLLSLNGASLQSVRDAWLPTSNNGFLFEISSRSFHAVTPIVGSTPRYSLILTFKSRQSLCFGGNWVPFPLLSDVDSAMSTASHMGISAKTFAKPYRAVLCQSVDDLRAVVGEFLENAPCGWSYRNGRSMNVDWNGQQSRVSDAERLRAVQGLKRTPPIVMVRRRSGHHCLVDGSHRLSRATDNRTGLTAVIFDEV